MAVGHDAWRSACAVWKPRDVERELPRVAADLGQRTQTRV